MSKLRADQRVGVVAFCMMEASGGGGLATTLGPIVDLERRRLRYIPIDAYLGTEVSPKLKVAKYRRRVMTCGR